MLADILGINPKNPTEIGTLKVDIVRSFEYQMDQEVTEHPVETGFEIHDSIINKAIKVDMTIGISSHPVTWFYKNSHGQHKFASGLSALEQIRDNKEPVTIVRPDKIWSDMVLTSARPVRNDESKSIIWVNCSFVHITKVATQTTEVPEDIVDESARDSAGETAADGGTATQTDIGSISSDSEEIEDAGEEKPLNKSIAAQGVDWGVKKIQDIMNSIGLGW